MREKSGNFNPHRYWSKSTLDREIKIFYEDLNFCVSRVCPKTQVKRRLKNPWWSDELSLQRREVRHLQQQTMRQKDDIHLLSQYRMARNNFCSAIRKAKRQSWKSFTEKADSMEDMMKVSKAILQKRSPRLGHLKKQDGTFTRNRREVLNTLLDSFFPGSKEAGLDREVTDQIHRYDISDLVTPEKLEQAFKSFKKGKAPGPDSVRPVVLQNLDGISSAEQCQLISGICP